MQRRAAAIYIALFLVIGAGSYALIATAQQPTVALESPEFRLSQGDDFTVDSRTYTASELSASAEGGGGGSAASISRQATFSWTNESARQTAELSNGTTVPYQGTNYTVLTPNSSNETTFTLRETVNRTAILQDDPNAENQLATQNGQKFVVVTENGSRTLIPPEEYFEQPATETVAEGDSFDYEGNTTTVGAVGTEAVTLEWYGPEKMSVTVGSGSNVTFADQQYLAFMPTNDTVVLENTYDDYRSDNQNITEFQERTSGLWGVVILSGAAVVFIAMLAFLPSRY
jgi:hypothetical protein